MAISYKNYRRIWFTITISYFAVGYLFLNWINSRRAFYYNFGFSFEENIPFVPYFIFGYSIDYLSVIVIYFLVTKKDRFTKMVKSYLLLTTIHFFFFVFVPVKMFIRPEVITDGGFLGAIVRFYYWMDMPYNCFPSLHVAYMLLGTLVLWNYKRTWAYIYYIGMLIVSVSVVFVKQHYVLDVVAGWITPFPVYWFYFKFKGQSKP